MPKVRPNGLDMSDVWRQMETCGWLEQMPAVFGLLLIKIERWQSLAHLRRRWGGSEFSTGSNRFDPHWIVTDVFGPNRGAARFHPLRLPLALHCVRGR